MTPEAPNPKLSIRAARPDDHAPLLALNRGAEPGVGAVDAAGLARLMSIAAATLVAEVDGRAVGFLLALAPTRDYGSANYRWFDARGGVFLYVDRIAVAAEARGRGVGAALYASAFAAAAGTPVVCEVNTVPPNPGSMRFHANLGFVEVGRGVHEPGVYEVAFLERRGGPHEPGRQ